MLGLLNLSQDGLKYFPNLKGHYIQLEICNSSRSYFHFRRHATNKTMLMLATTKKDQATVVHFIDTCVKTIITLARANLPVLLT